MACQIKLFLKNGTKINLTYSIEKVNPISTKSFIFSKATYNPSRLIRGTDPVIYAVPLISPYAYLYFQPSSPLGVLQLSASCILR